MAGRARFRIEGEDATAAAWKSVVGNANATADKITGAFHTAFAGLSAAVLVDIGKQALEMGDQLSLAGKKAGITGQAMSELAFAAKQSNVEIESLSVALKKQQVFLSQASSGGKQQIETLDALGLKLKQLKGLKADEQFELLGERISQLKDDSDRTRAAVELFGKAGEDLLPLFEHGAAGIRKLREESNELGASLTNEQIKKLADADEAVKRLTAAWHGFASTLTSVVSPAIIGVANALTSALSNDRRSQLEEQIAFLEKVKGEGFISLNPFGSKGTYTDLGTGIHSAEAGAKQLADLKRQLAFYQAQDNLHPELGGRGRGAAAPPPGYADAAAAAEALKKQEEFNKKFEKANEEFQLGLSADLDKSFKADEDRMQKRFDMSDEFQARQKKSEQELADYRDQLAQQSAEKFKGLFLSAFDDMVNTGKIHWKELLKYFAAELIRAKLAAALDSWVSSFGKSSGKSGGGFWSSVGGVVASIFGSGKASGGPVSAGTVYPVGEQGPELFAPGMNGSIIPNSALGGQHVTIVNNIDARGATTDLVKALPKILDANSKATEARIIDRMRRGFYPGLAS